MESCTDVDDRLRSVAVLNRAFVVGIVVGLPVAVVVAAYVVVESMIEVDGETVRHEVSAARTAWLMIAIGVAAMVLFAGWAVNRELFGAFIDSRNRYSLSRLQLAAWTALVLSVWLAVVLVRITADIPVADALQVGLPGAVVAVLGLSTGSFALSSAVKDRKRQQAVTPAWWAELQARRRRVAEQLARATRDWRDKTEARDLLAQDDPLRAALEKQVEEKETKLAALRKQLTDLDTEAEAQRTAEGLLVRNESPADARASDLFQGEEVVDAQTVDFGKVQMLFITIAIIGAYGFILAEAIGDRDLFAATEGGVTFPDLAESLVALLGISHGGYLAVKASNSTAAAP